MWSSTKWLLRHSIYLEALLWAIQLGSGQAIFVFSGKYHSHRIHAWYIYTYIYHQNQLNVANYTMHGSYGMDMSYMSDLATPRHVSMSGRLQHQDSGGEVSNIFHVKEK